MRWPTAAFSRLRAHRDIVDISARAVSTSSSTDYGGWTLTLERGIGKAYGSEAALIATDAFGAEVFPDLPIATTWQNLAKALRGRLNSAAAADPSPPFTHYTTRPGALKVVTAAANLRSRHELELRILQAAGDGSEAVGGQRANALLCVSGSHPVRSLPFVAGLFRSSLDSLRIAQRLKQQGYIPHSTELWVVANPNTERNAELLEIKAELGANAVLTQPPLDWPAYMAWLEDAERRGLLRPATPPPPAPTISAHASPEHLTSSATASPGAAASVPGRAAADPSQLTAEDLEAQPRGGSGGGGGGPVRLLVGHPVTSSAANLSFWTSLSGSGRSAAAQQLLAEAMRAELEGPEAAARYFAAYNKRLVRQVLERGGVAGFHVMPITKAAKKAVLQMLADGTLPPSAC